MDSSLPPKEKPARTRIFIRDRAEVLDSGVVGVVVCGATLGYIALPDLWYVKALKLCSLICGMSRH
jgi:hypothetical protein